MKRFLTCLVPTLLRGMIVVMLFSIFVVGAIADEETESQAIPDFSLKGLDGKTATFSEIKGEKATFITFWATWCKPCMQEMPHLQELYEKYQEHGFLVIGISEDAAKKTAKVKKVVNQQKFTFPILLDPTGDQGKKLGMPSSLPYGLLIDGDGNLVEKTLGYQKGDEEVLEKKILELLDLEEEKTEDE